MEYGRTSSEVGTTREASKFNLKEVPTQFPPTPPFVVPALGYKAPVLLNGLFVS